MDNRRKYTRFRAAIAAEVALDTEVFECETRDVSAGGVSVVIDEPAGEGSEVQLTLILTEDGIASSEEEDLTTRAQVMWAAPTDDGACMMGLRFSRLVPADQARLDRFLAALAETLPPDER